MFGQEVAFDDLLEVVCVIALVGVDEDLMTSSEDERGGMSMLQ